METTIVVKQEEAPRKQRSVYGTGKFKWAVYPDFWKKAWGPKPLLGYVYADDEFYAKRESYNRGLIHGTNFTIGPDVVKIGPAPVSPPRKPQQKMQ